MECAINFLDENVNEQEKEVLKISYNILRKLHIPHSCLDDSIRDIVDLVDQKAQPKLDLIEFRKYYSIDSIFIKASKYGGKFPKI